MNRSTTIIDIGLTDYKEAWDYQLKLFNETLAIKAANRDLPTDQQKETPNYLIFCEHPHVYTLGRNGKESNLLIDEAKLKELHATYYHIHRGGDITYHGPGQIVVYPILDLENFYTDIHRYMRDLEESVIKTLEDFGLKSGRIDGLTGVWLDYEDIAKARKICALGVKTSRWVTMHGLAMNVNTDLTFFNHIVPCGIDDKAVTSLRAELGGNVDFEKVKNILKGHLIEQFKMKPASVVA